MKTSPTWAESLMWFIEHPDSVSNQCSLPQLSAQNNSNQAVWVRRQSPLTTIRQHYCNVHQMSTCLLEEAVQSNHVWTEGRILCFVYPQRTHNKVKCNQVSGHPIQRLIQAKEFTGSCSHKYVSRKQLKWWREKTQRCRYLNRQQVGTSHTHITGSHADSWVITWNFLCKGRS